MKQVCAAVLLTLSVAACAQPTVSGAPASPGHQVKVSFYSGLQPTPKGLLWTAVFEGQEVEFDVERRSQVNSFCVSEPFLNNDLARGFVVKSSNGDDKDERWTFMPKSVKSGENQWCFAARHSYRFDVWLVGANGDVVLQHPVNFEIEQQWRYVTDLRLGSQDFKRRAKPCTERFCGDIIRAK